MNLANKLRTFAKKRRIGIAALVMLLFLGTVGYGVHRLTTYTVPMHTNDFAHAAESGYANKPLALYDLGLQLYRAGDYEAATEKLMEAYSELMADTNGDIPADRQQLAGDIQFVLGNALVKQEMFAEAVQAYMQALRHTPDNMAAKYNLEMLLQGGAPGQGEGDGDGDGQPQPGDQPGTQPGHGGNQGI